jgi:hypothetical protein
MTEPAKRGDAAWREQRDAISKRNAEASAKAQKEHTRDDALVERQRQYAVEEQERLRVLNEKLAKRR